MSGSIEEALAVSGLTERQLRYWLMTFQKIRVGSGYPVTLDADQMRLVVAYASLLRAGFTNSVADSLSTAIIAGKRPATVSLPGGWVLSEQ